MTRTLSSTTGSTRPCSSTSPGSSTAPTTGAVEDAASFFGWLSSHILGTDDRYVPRMRDAGRGNREDVDVGDAIADPIETGAEPPPRD